MKQKLLNSLRLRACMLVALLCAGVSAAWGQESTTLFLETFGSASNNTAMGSYSGYSATSNMFNTNGNHYSGSGTVGKSNLSAANLSNGYEGASGESGIYHVGTANTEAVIIQIEGIKIEGYENLSLSFGALGGSSSHKVNVSYKIDDGDEKSLIEDGAITNANWTLLTASIPDTGNSLTLIFKHKPSKAWTIRMDDIKVTGTAITSGKTIPSIEVEGYRELLRFGTYQDLTITTNSDRPIQAEILNNSNIIYTKDFSQENGVATVNIRPNLSNLVGQAQYRIYVEESEVYAAAERILTFNVRKSYTQTEIDATGITNTDIASGPAAGSLLANMLWEQEDGSYKFYLNSNHPDNLFTWSSSDENVATVASDGTVTLVGAGTTTITANFNGTNLFEASSATYELTVTDSDAPEPITLWSEDFGSYSDGEVPNGGTYSYSVTDGGSKTKVYGNDEIAGGTKPELLVGKSGGSFTAVVPLNHASGQLTLTYKTNAQSMSVSTTTTGIGIRGADENGKVTFNTKEEHTVTFTGVTTSMSSITIVFTAESGSNVRLDDIELVGSAEVNAVEAPTFSINGGTYYTPQTVELSCDTEGAAIKYSFDETTTWSDYTEALTINETKTIYAKAVKNGKESTVSSITVTIAEKNNVVFNIENKTLAVGESYRLTIGTGKDVQSDGRITLTSDNTVATIDNITITAAAVGTATITISVAEGDTYKAGTTTFTVTVLAPEGQSTAPAGAGTIFYESFDGCDSNGGNDENFATASNAVGSASSNADNDGWEMLYDYAALNCAKFGGSKNEGSATTPDIAATVSATYTLTFKAAPWSSEEATMNVTATGATISGISTNVMTAGQWNDFTATVTATASTFTLTFASNKNRFFLDEVVITDPNAAAPSFPVKLNAKGYATYCNQYPLNFADNDDVTAWILTGIEKNGDGTYKMNYTQITGGVKGGVGMLLKGTAEATVSLTSADSDNVPSGNKFVGTLAPTFVEEGAVYGLSGDTFKKSASAGTVKANKAFIPASKLPADAKSFIFVFEDETTGIRTMETHSAEEVKAIFNIAGQRLQNMQKGINIVGGKKILVK